MTPRKYFELFEVKPRKEDYEIETGYSYFLKSELQTFTKVELIECYLELQDYIFWKGGK